jgi:hypothetical protein
MVYRSEKERRQKPCPSCGKTDVEIDEALKELKEGAGDDEL